MRKPAFCICENKDADQLRSNCEADHRLCFRYISSTIPLLPKSCTVRFMSDLVGNPEDRFSHNEANLFSLTLLGSRPIYYSHVEPLRDKTYAPIENTQPDQYFLYAQLVLAKDLSFLLAVGEDCNQTRLNPMPKLS